MYFRNDIIFRLPELYLLTIGTLILVYGVWFRSRAGYDYPVIRQNTGYLVLLTFILTGFLFFDRFNSVPFNTT
jgi:hypothetical protein